MISRFEKLPGFSLAYSLAYSLALGLLLLPAWVAALFLPKLRAGLTGRLGWRTGFRASLKQRDLSRPLVLFHAASAGELLQAEPVMKRLRKDGAQLAVSLSSVSGLGWLQRLGDWDELVWAGLLPLDFPWNTRLLLKGLSPAAIVYLQAELWPGLVMTAKGRGIPQALIAARIGQGRNYRASFPLHGFYSPLYGAMGKILSATERDRAAIAEIVPGHPGLEVGGDPGIETVLNRLRETEESAPLSGLLNWGTPGDYQVIIAGSSWPADEEALLPVLKEAAREHPDLRIVLAPHEPVEASLKNLESALAELEPVRLSLLESGGDPPEKCRVALVDRVGVLASLYQSATVAYVGGAFTSGVHNVAEPAACGLPVIFGPRYNNSSVAKALLESGAALTITDGRSLREALLPLLSDKNRQIKMGEKGKALVNGLADAAEMNYRTIREMVAGLNDEIPG